MEPQKFLRADLCPDWMQKGVMEVEILDIPVAHDDSTPGRLMVGPAMAGLRRVRQVRRVIDAKHSVEAGGECLLLSAR
jgi:hypothetical protein